MSEINYTFTTASASTPPTADTLPVSSITADSARLNGRVNPNSAATTYYFEWGTSASYGEITSVTSAGSGSTDISALADISGLDDRTLYHYRVVAVNAKGTTYGDDIKFRTSRRGITDGGGGDGGGGDGQGGMQICPY